LHGLLGGLRLERRTVDVAASIHSPLESVSLPSKQIVAVLPVSGAEVKQHKSETRVKDLDTRRESETKTYASPILYKNGCRPSSGHRLLSLNARVSHMTSYMTWGILTGCDAGQGPLLSKVPLSGYATWLLWSGLSRFCPSQHLAGTCVSFVQKVSRE
jgi:hypothetical protein